MKGILFSIRGYQNSLSKKQFKVCCSTVAAPVTWMGLGKEIFGVIFYDLFLHGGGQQPPGPMDLELFLASWLEFLIHEQH